MFIFGFLRLIDHLSQKDGSPVYEVTKSKEVLAYAEEDQVLIRFLTSKDDIIEDFESLISPIEG